MLISYENGTSTLFCDCCGKETTLSDISIECEFDDGGCQDRCYGSTGIEALRIENEMYDKHQENDRFWTAEHALMSDKYSFCYDCCGDSDSPPLVLHNGVRAVRAKVLTKFLESGPRKKHPLEEAAEIVEHGKQLTISTDFCHSIWATKDKELIDALDELRDKRRELLDLLENKVNDYLETLEEDED